LGTGRKRAAGDDPGWGGRFRGIRFITASHPEQAAWASAVIRPEGLLMNLKLREGFARLAPLGLSFDAWMYHTQLGELVDLARTFPGRRSRSTTSVARSASEQRLPVSGL
jgi:hypothetical protein